MENRKILIILVILYIGGVLVRPLPAVPVIGSVPILLYCISLMFYCTACIYWIFTLNRRIIDRRQKAYLIATACMILLLHSLQILKYNLSGDSDTVRRYIWYLYYVPLTLASLFSAFTAIRVGKSETDPPDRKSFFFTALAAVIIVAVLTNDTHQLMFRFYDGMADWDHTYTRGPIFYVQSLFAYGMILYSLVTAIRKCTVASSRKRAAVPLISVAVGFVLLLIFYGETSGGKKIFGIEFFTFQMIWGAMFVLFWESCIRVGLVPSNNDYEKIFESASIGATITDLDGNVLYRSKNSVQPDEDMILDGSDFTAILKGTTKLYGMRIRGGYVYWQEDIERHLAINNELYEAAERLREENDILAQENDLKAEQVRTETTNRLYDAIASKVRPQTLKVERLLGEAREREDDFDSKISEAAICLAYIKRTANLELMRQKSERIGAADLQIAVRESMEYAAISGMSCDARLEVDGEVDASDLCGAYDLIEEILENGYDITAALMVWIYVKDGLSLRIEISPKKDVGNAKWTGFIEYLRRYALRRSDYRVLTVSAGDDDDLILEVTFSRVPAEGGASA